MPHRVRKISNNGKKDAKRTFVSFFLVDPRDRITSTLELPPLTRQEQLVHTEASSDEGQQRLALEQMNKLTLNDDNDDDNDKNVNKKEKPKQTCVMYRCPRCFM